MGSFASNPYAVPVIEAPVDARVAFLRSVGLWTFGGLLVASVTAMLSAGAILAVPALQGRWISLGIMLAAIFGAQFVGNALVRSEDRGTQVLGLLAGTGL